MHTPSAQISDFKKIDNILSKKFPTLTTTSGHHRQTNDYETPLHAYRRKITASSTSIVMTHCYIECKTDFADPMLGKTLHTTNEAQGICIQ
jgi:hypothetical protein